MGNLFTSTKPHLSIPVDSEIKVEFGFENRSLEDIRGALAVLNDCLERVNRGVNTFSNILEIATTLAPYMRYVSFAFSLLAKLIGQADKFYKALDETERRILGTALDGKLEVLKHSLANLEDENTQDTQKIAEMVCSVNCFREILPVFKRTDSPLHWDSDKFYMAAPLFRHICGLLAVVLRIAEGMPGYNNARLPELRNEYREVLNSYEISCTRERLRSTHVFTLDIWAEPDGCYESYYYDDMVEKDKYFDRPGSWRREAMRPGFRSAGGGMCHAIKDGWIPKRYDEINYTSVEYEPHQVYATEKRCLKEYRQKIIRATSDFFHVPGISSPQ